MSSGGINKQPSGLLDFLGIKNFGQYPGILSGVLQPSIDLVPWYLSQNSRSQFFNASVTAVGFNIFTTVPQDQTYAVIGTLASSSAVLGAGVTLAIGAGYIRDTTANIVSPLTPIGVAAVTGAVAACASVQDVIWVPAGASIGIYCTQLVAGPVACTLNLNYVPMLR